MEPRWLTIARNYIGVTEIPGAKSNSTILGWAKWLKGWFKSFFTDDDIPWCAVFVNACLGEAGVTGTGTLAARDFEKWGRTGPLALGAILVFKRPTGGHVGFYMGEREDGALRVLGGNQSNTVSEIWIERARLTGIRWPETEPLPNSGRIKLASNGDPVSTNEA